MIKSFEHKGLIKLYESGSKQGVNPEHATPLRLILARLDASTASEDMNLPGLSLHRLKGSMKKFWPVSVSGNWRVIFRFKDGYAIDVDGAIRPMAGHARCGEDQTTGPCVCINCICQF